MNLKKLKQEVLLKVTELLDSKINTLQSAIKSTKESRKTDTKSSAGDKFETGRSMMQMEIEKNESQLNKLLKEKHDISQINLQSTFSKVEFGSLVVTNHESYLISISLGKIASGTTSVYCITLASPLGKALFNKEEGNEFEFLNKKYTIKSIV